MWPLQLFVSCGLIVLCLFCVAVFGITYEADSMVMLERQIEEGNSTLHSLEVNVDRLGDSNKRWQRLLNTSLRENVIKEQIIRMLKERLKKQEELADSRLRNYQKGLLEETKWEEEHVNLMNTLDSEKETEHKLHRENNQLRKHLAHFLVRSKGLVNETKHGEVVNKQLNEQVKDLRQEVFALDEETSQLRSRVTKQKRTESVLMGLLLGACCVGVLGCLCVQNPQDALRSLKTRIEV